MMVEIAFPKLQLVLQIPDILGDRVIIAPVAPYSSLVALGSLGSLVSDVLDHETHEWTKYLVNCLAAAEDAGPVSSIRTAESSQSQSSQAFNLSQLTSSSSSGSSSVALFFLSFSYPPLFPSSSVRHLGHELEPGGDGGRRCVLREAHRREQSSYICLDNTRQLDGKQSDQKQ